MAQPETRILLLHGLGDTPDSYQELTRTLRTRQCHVSIPHLLHLSPWSLSSCTTHVAGTLDGEPTHIIGHSLGAVIALNLAQQYPHLVTSLLLSAPQVKVSQPLMAIQQHLMRFLPAHLVAPPGLTKTEMVSIMSSLAHIDLRSVLKEINQPVTIACGRRDIANLHAARTIHSLMPQSRLNLIPGAGHQWITQHPRYAAALIHQHIQHINQNE